MKTMIKELAAELAEEGYTPDMESEIANDITYEMRKFLFEEDGQWYWAFDSTYSTDEEIRNKIEQIMDPDTTLAEWWKNYYAPMHIEKYGLEDYRTFLDTFGKKVRER